jgi:Cu/Zn superoxide dismutase
MRPTKRSLTRESEVPTRKGTLMHNRTIRRLTAAAATAALVVTFNAAAAGAATADRGAVRQLTAPLTDLQPGVDDPLDGATARLIMIEHSGSTTFVLIVTRVDPTAAGRTYGAHLHVGPCVAGNGPAAGPHYNTGGAPSPTTEVWLDFTVNAGGVGVATTTVPFVPLSGVRSVVIHAEPTAPSGSAGDRLECLPVVWWS